MNVKTVVVLFTTAAIFGLVEYFLMTQNAEDKCSSTGVGFSASRGC